MGGRGDAGGSLIVLEDPWGIMGVIGGLPWCVGQLWTSLDPHCRICQGCSGHSRPPPGIFPKVITSSLDFFRWCAFGAFRYLLFDLPLELTSVSGILYSFL